MANPGPYPPMNQPMGGPMQPMGPPRGPMGPMGGMQPRPPMRQGTSKIVPVVVSAGLAIGVFCGLLFGLGTKKSEADPGKVSNGVKRTEETVADPALGSATPTPGDSAAKAATTATTGSAAVATTGTPATGSAGGTASSAGSAVAAIAATKLVVDIQPEGAVPTAKVFINGKEISGTALDIPLLGNGGKQKVKIVVKSTGYKDGEQDVEIPGDATSFKVEVELMKKERAVAGDTGNATGGSTGTTGNTGTTGSGGSKTNGGTKTNTGTKGNGKKGSGGLIDI